VLRRLIVALAGAGLPACLFPAQALAHGLVGKEDLPIPKWLFGWAASVVLIASFVGLAVLWQRPRLEGRAGGRVLRVPGVAILEAICGLIGVALFVLVVYAGFEGAQVTPNNFSPTFVLVVFWVGLVPASLLLGDVFAAFNPWRAVARGVAWVAQKVSRAGLPAPLPYPARLGRWPAAAMILVFVWFELVHYLGAGVPQDVAVAALIYAAAQFIGMSLYGVEAWGRYGDGFSVYFGLFARLSPLRWKRGGVQLRAPLSGLTTLDPVPGTIALLATMIGTTSFDGFSQGPVWQTIQPEMTKAIRAAGVGQPAAIDIASTIGLVSCVLIVGGLFVLGVHGMHRDTHVKLSPSELAGRFAHSLVPIAMAYVIAHYFSELAFQGQALVYLASNPLGDGTDLFGTAGRGVDFSWVSATAIWYVQVGALVLGHVAGLMLAHDRALITFKDPRTATRSQYWMLAVMIAFTSLGLWLLSAAGS
jgi:hypothetical protein